MLWTVYRPKESVDVLAITCVPSMMLTSADGSGWLLPASLTTPVMSAFAGRAGMAAATPEENVSKASASDMRAPSTRIRVYEKSMNCLNDGCQLNADRL